METTPNNGPTISNGILRALFYLITGFMVCGILQLVYDNIINRDIFILTNFYIDTSIDNVVIYQLQNAAYHKSGN